MVSLLYQYLQNVKACRQSPYWIKEYLGLSFGTNHLERENIESAEFDWFSSY